MKKNLLKNSAVQTLVASLLCIVLGLFLGYLVLLLMPPFNPIETRKSA